MGVSAMGESLRMSSVRHLLATLLVFLGLFYLLFGPAVTPAMVDAARDRCNTLTGGSYRDYDLQWRSLSFRGLHHPHWACFDIREGQQRVFDLGWWVDL